MSTGITIHFAILAEQVVSPTESSCPRRPLGPLLDWTGNFERKLEYLDRAGVGTYWLYGFRGAEGTMRDIGLLKAAKAKLERLGKEAYVICEPLGHPGGEPPVGSPNREGPPGQGWRYRINADGNPDWGSACLDEIVLRDLVAATTAFRNAGFKKVFFDASFDPPEGKAAEIESIRMHMAQVGDVSRLYSENTVDPWPKLRPENMAKKLLIEVEQGLRNIMLMPPPLIDAPEYWEAIAAVLPEAKAIASKQPEKETQP